MRANILILLCVLLGGLLSSTRAAPQSAPSPEPAQNVGSGDVSGSHHGPTDALVFLVVALLLGVFTHHIQPVTRIPYTNLLLVGLICFSCQQTVSCSSTDSLEHDDKLTNDETSEKYLSIPGVGSHHWHREPVLC